MSKSLCARMPPSDDWADTRAFEVCDPYNDCADAYAEVSQPLPIAVIDGGVAYDIVPVQVHSLGELIGLANTSDADAQLLITLLCETLPVDVV